MASTSETAAFEPTADIDVLLQRHGSYIRLAIQPKGEPVRRFRISEGAAETLRDELIGLLSGSRPAKGRETPSRLSGDINGR